MKNTDHFFKVLYINWLNNLRRQFKFNFFSGQRRLRVEAVQGQGSADERKTRRDRDRAQRDETESRRRS